MTYTFDTTAMATWARMSGDYNPIHFDLARARAAGAEDLIVHGMLPLLHVHQNLSSWFEPASTAGGMTSSCDELALWPTIKTVFRFPVIKDRAHRLDLNLQGGRGRFALRATQPEKDTLCGWFALTKPSCNSVRTTDSDLTTCRLDARQLAAKLGEFAKSFPMVDRLWIAVCALAFGEFLSSRTALAPGSTSGPVNGNSVREQLFGDRLVVQTLHHVAIAPSIANEPLREATWPRTMQCTLHPALTPLSARNEVHRSFPVDVAIDGRTAVQMTLGLLMRSAAGAPTAVKVEQSA